MTRALDVALSLAWAMEPDALRALLAVAGREDIPAAVLAEAMHGPPNPEAVAAKEGRPLDKADAIAVRDGVAIMSVEGPIFRYANLFTDVSGATSVEMMAKDLHAALADSAVHSILMHVDSPGGEVAGISEFAEMIWAARRIKPITAYISHYGASAAYWISAAADRIVVSDTALVGSIGAVLAVPDPRKDKSKDIEFVSSTSPNKRADPTTASGADQYQQTVDKLGDVFLKAVSRYRGMDVESVISAGNEGGIVVGSDAVKVGLADALGSFEGTIAEMAGIPRPAPPRARKPARPAALARLAARTGPAHTGGRMDRFDKFLAYLMGEQGAPVEATPEASVNDQQATPTSSLVQNDHAHPQIPPAAVPVAGSEDAQRLRELEAENRRLRASMIHDRAVAFARSQVNDLRAFPAEEAGLVALFAQMAADDEQYGAVASAAGTTTRVTLLEAALASRPSASVLTGDRAARAAAQVLINEASRPAPGDGPMTKEREAELMKASDLGRAIVNGEYRSN